MTVAKIDALQNGLHSIAQALRAFEEINDPERLSAFSTKQAIYFSHHGIEVLSKYILLKINPVLLINDDLRIKEALPHLISYHSGKDKTWPLPTIRSRDAISRLHQIIGATHFQSGEFETLQSRLAELNNFRNALEHFAFEGDVSRVSVVVGTVLPIFCNIIQRIFLPKMDIYKEISVFLPNTKEIIEHMTRNYHDLFLENDKYLRKLNETDLQLRIDVSFHHPWSNFPIVKLRGPINISFEDHELRMRRDLRLNSPDNFDMNRTGSSIFDNLRNLVRFDGNQEVNTKELPPKKVSYSRDGEKITEESANYRSDIKINNMIIVSSPTDVFESPYKEKMQFISHLKFYIALTISVYFYRLSSHLIDYHSECTDPEISLLLVASGDKIDDDEKHVSLSFIPKTISEVKRTFICRSSEPIAEDMNYDFIYDLRGSLETKKKNFRS